jgi:methylamine dehydrogenase heavy chain
MASPAFGDLPIDRAGRVETLPAAAAPHWVWVADLVLQRSALVDLDEGRFLGILNGGYATIAPLFPARRPEIYVPSTFYSRLTRGERTDVISIFDAISLAATGEIEIPPKRAIDAVALAHAALSDDERFLAVYNMTPATSLSIVDLEQRVFVGEISTPGCALVYGAGERRFLMLCGDGSALTVTLDETGHEASKQRSEPFFDPERDPVTEKAVRAGDTWIFVSFQGRVHTVDVSGRELRFDEPWSLFGPADREDSWRIGGLQHLAVHAETGRLYSLVHQGPVDTHKEPGSEVWVHDLATRKRRQRIELRNPGLTVHGVPIEFGTEWIWPFSGLSDWLVDSVLPPMVGQILVTQDADPRLVTASQFFGSLGVYDARSGEFLRRVKGIGMTTDVLQAAPLPGSAR